MKIRHAGIEPDSLLEPGDGFHRVSCSVCQHGMQVVGEGIIRLNRENLAA